MTFHTPTANCPLCGQLLMAQILRKLNVKIGDVGNYSAVFEWAIPTNDNGNYTLNENGAFGPVSPTGHIPHQINIPFILLLFQELND